MQFETEYIYHIYNQGNNRQRIFFSDENYLYFSSRPRENTQKSLRSPTSLIIGPEGGFSEEEEKALHEEGVI